MIYMYTEWAEMDGQRDKKKLKAVVVSKSSDRLGRQVLINDANKKLLSVILFSFVKDKAP